MIDLAIILQSFIFNVFGSIDNLAWIWVKEKQTRDKKGRPLRGQQVGLTAGCAAVRDTFSSEFQQYLRIPTKSPGQSEMISPGATR